MRGRRAHPCPSRTWPWPSREPAHGRGRDLNLDQLHATYVDGVLSLTIPVSERSKPRRIVVEHTAAQQSGPRDECGVTYAS